MGQAVVDLPDPLENPNAVQGLSADDLLSKMASEEIDRLLAGDDETPEPEPAPVPSAEAAPPPTAEPPAPVVAAPVVVSPGSDLDSVLSSAASPLTGTDLDELPPAPQPEVAAAQAPVNTDQPIQLPKPAHKELPFFLRPLVWLNIPLDSSTDAFRDAIGKVAILTLVNAVSVLVYVFLFRKHH